MKQCCKNGDQDTTEKSVVKKWFIYASIAIIHTGAFFLQLTGG